MSEDLQIDEELFSILSNPTRRKILKFIEEIGGATYTDLIEEFELKSGPLYYHLRQMKLFVYQGDDKKYFLTEKGKTTVLSLQGKKEHEYEIYEEQVKPKVFSIWKFTLAPFIRFFAKIQSDQRCRFCSCRL